MLDERDEHEPKEPFEPESPVTERVRIIGAQTAAVAAEGGAAPGEPSGSPWAGPGSGEDAPRSLFDDPEVPDLGIGSGEADELLSDPVELPHWSAPPTGQVPAVLDRRSAEERDAPWAGGPNDTGPVWREQAHEWEDEGFEPALLADDETRVGVLEDTPLEQRRPWEFDEADLDDGAVDPPTETLRVASGLEEDVDLGAPSPYDDLDVGVGGWDAAETEGPAGGVGGGFEVPAPRAVLGRSGPEVTTISSSPLRGEGPAAPPVRRRRRPPEPPKGGRNVPTAIATGVVVAAVGLVCFALGTVATEILATVVVTLAMAECYAAFRAAGRRPATLLGLVATVAVMVAAYTKGVAALPLVLVLVVMGTMVWYLAGVDRGSAVEGIAVTLLGFGWVGLFGSFAALLLAPSQFPDRHGIAFLLGAVVAVVGNDVGALGVGGWLGRHQLAPRISPNKTWEGWVGGAVVGIVLSVVLTGSVHPWTPAKAALLGVVVAVLAPLGDLCESLVKRDLGLKDMGAALPGHGGVLDRFDAMLFVLPATYYLVRLVHLG